MSEEEPRAGLNRRDVLKRGAMVGGALVWTTPIVQSMAGPAVAAQGSPLVPELCAFELELSVFGGGQSGCVRISATSLECCEALTVALAAPIATRLQAIIGALTSQACLTGGGTSGECQA